MKRAGNGETDRVAQDSNSSAQRCGLEQGQLRIATNAKGSKCTLGVRATNYPRESTSRCKDLTDREEEPRLPEVRGNHKGGQHTTSKRRRLGRGGLGRGGSSSSELLSWCLRRRVAALSRAIRARQRGRGTRRAEEPALSC